MTYVMTDDTAQGITWELHYILRPEWTMTQQEDGFRVGPPSDATSPAMSIAELSNEVWRIAQFVAYRDFTSIRFDSDTGSFILDSHRKNGTGFRIYFVSTPTGLPDHRPKPAIEEESD